MADVRFVAIGDSFTEGVGDVLPDGRERGWADIAAQGWADAAGHPIQYANLAIRGKLAWPIVEDHEGIVILTTNLPFENWTEVLGNERLTGAALDRQTHRGHIIETRGESYRLQDATRRRF